MTYHFQRTLSQFGGWFKEALAVACLSKRCYKLVRSIMVSRKASHQKINRGVFKNLPGVKDELYLYSQLQKVDNESIGIADFKKSDY